MALGAEGYYDDGYYYNKDGGATCTQFEIRLERACVALDLKNRYMTEFSTILMVLLLSLKKND